MKEKPSGLLCHAKVTDDFIRRDTVFAVPYKPYRDQPLVQPNRGIFKDRSGLRRELLAAFLVLALEDKARCEESDFAALAVGSDNAFGPTQSAKELDRNLRFGEVPNRFNERLWDMKGG